MGPHTGLDRRSLLGIAAAISVASQAQAQPTPQVIDLWPAAPPDGAGPHGPEQVGTNGSITNVSRPRLLAYGPAKPNGTAIVVISGGGYAHIEAGKESTPACRWLQSIGATAFELIYRLPGEGWSRNAPFQDGQRAMRIVRAHAGSYEINPARIGVIGFSAGGHLAGMISVLPDKPFYQPVDGADTTSARPDFAGLIYPVLTMMPPYDHTHSRRSVLGLHPTEAESVAYSVERHVDARTPPTFLAQAADDPISPVENSVMMFQALRGARVPAELHIFQSGRHGWGMGPPSSETRIWPGPVLQLGGAQWVPSAAAAERIASRFAGLAASCHAAASNGSEVSTMDKPTMDEQSIQQAAATLVQARRTMQPIANLPDACRPATVADAHAIQDATTAALGKAVGAYKANAPADGEPNRGVIYEGTIHASPARMPVADVPACGVEGEVAFIFRRDLPPRARPYTRDEVSVVVDPLPAIEVVNSRFGPRALDRRATSNLEVLADSTSNGGFVHATPVADWRALPLGRLKVRLTVNGETVVEKEGGHPTGDPLRTAVSLANMMRDTTGVRAGQFVTCGSWTGLRFLKPGDVCGVWFEGLGEAEVTFTG